MKDLLKDNAFNDTIRIFLCLLTVCFLIFCFYSCEINKIEKAKTIEELSKSGAR